MKTLFAVSLALLVPAAHAAAAGKRSQNELGPGAYTAAVAALPCGACGKKVVETLKADPAISQVSVDDAKSRVAFTVASGAKVDLKKLQARLKAAADKMGMGADYRLSDVARAKKAP